MKYKRKDSEVAKRMGRNHEGNNNKVILPQCKPKTEDEHRSDTQLHGNGNRSRKDQVIPT